MSDETKRHESIRQSRRRFLRIGGTAAVAGLAGCSQDGGESGDGGSGGGDSDGDTTQTEADSGDSGNEITEDVTISFWPAWGGYYEETFNAMISDFEDRHDRITVDMSPQGSYRESRNALFNAANAGNPPDIGHLDKGSAIIARDSGFFTPIEDIWPDVDPSNYLGPAMGTSIINDTIWSLPFNNSQIILYYNKDHFKQAGLDPETPPKSLDEMAQMANTVVDEGVADYGVSWPNHSWWITSWISEQKAFVCNKKNGRMGEPSETFFTSPETKTIYDFWINKLGDAYHNPGIEDWGSSEQAFQNGVSAMHMNSTGSLAYSLSGFKENDINVGVAALPVPGEKVGHPMGGAAVWVSKKDRSDNKRLAIQRFLKDMLGPKQQAFYHRETGYLPSHTKSLSKLEEWFSNHPDTYAVARDQLKAWQELPMTQGILMGPSSQIYKEVARQSDEMLQGTAIDKGLQAMKSYGDDQLNRYVRS